MMVESLKDKSQILNLVQLAAQRMLLIPVVFLCLITAYIIRSFTVLSILMD